MPDNRNRLFWMFGYHLIDFMHHPGLHLVHRFTIRKTGSTGIKLDDGPGFLFGKFFDSLACPGSVINFHNTRSFCNLQVVMFGNGLGCFHRSFQGTSIEGVQLSLGQSLAQRLSLLPAKII